MRRGVQGAKNAVKFAIHLFSPSNIKHQLGVMQSMSIPELIVGFFKVLFYSFYYSGYGVSLVIKYLLINVLMSLMRGPAEEVTDAAPVEEDRFSVKPLPALTSDDSSKSVQPFGADASREETGRGK